MYLGLSRDGLLPSVFSKVHPLRHTPIHSQVWVGLVAGIMAGLFNVHQLSHILSVGTLVCPFSFRISGLIILHIHFTSLNLNSLIMWSFLKNFCLTHITIIGWIKYFLFFCGIDWLFSCFGMCDNPKVEGQSFQSSFWEVHFSPLWRHHMSCINCFRWFSSWTMLPFQWFFYHYYICCSDGNFWSSCCPISAGEYYDFDHTYCVYFNTISRIQVG